MKNRDSIPEPSAKSSHRLPGKGDLRNQDNRLFSLLQHFPDQIHIDQRFSASGYSADQTRTILSVPFLQNAVPDFFLVGSQLTAVLFRRRQVRSDPFRILQQILRIPDNPVCLHGDQSVFLKALQDRGRDPRLFHKTDPVRAALHARFQKGTNRALLCFMPLLPALLQGALQHFPVRKHPDAVRSRRLLPFLYRQNRLKRAVHGRSVVFFHPDSQLQETPLNRKPALLNLQNRPYPALLYPRTGTDTDHISINGAGSSAERNPHRRSLPYTVPEIFRNSVLKGFIQAFLRDIYNYISIQFLHPPVCLPPGFPESGHVRPWGISSP